MKFVSCRCGLLGCGPSSCELRFDISPLNSIGDGNCLEPLVCWTAYFQVIFEYEYTISVRGGGGKLVGFQFAKPVLSVFFAAGGAPEHLDRWHVVVGN